ncbi:MAG: maltose alpha-D-glucosyltransferase [Nitrososphaerota archaeon]|nr:maltose alpha-D-glucosyltransferase [Nitrososphaerota archaeon]
MKREDNLNDDPQWYKDSIIYELHVKTFYDTAVDGIGDFRGLTSKLDYLTDLGINTIWLLPFYPSPLKDDGYDISDYFDVHPLYGKLKDFKDFLDEAHSRGIRVITELVLNHTSDQHLWFKKSRVAEPGSRWREFYVWSDTPEKYKEARIIFKDFEASNWTYDNVAKSYYWHRFYSHQPDLNFDNELTRETMLHVVDFWLKLGVDGLRLDAVPYLFEREGTNCENLPETHQFLKKLRAHIDANFKNRMLLAEANQWPTDAAAYFGQGDECHMAFHFPLMPRMFMAVQMEDRSPIVEILEQTPKIPDSAQLAVFLRNHDELTLEMVTEEERDYMYRAYARDKKSRLNLGIRRRLAPLLGNDRRKIELLNALLFTLPGTPLIYYGDEIGMGDNIYLGDRNGVRTPMQWNADMNAGFSKSNPQKLYLPVVIEPQYHYEVVNVENQQNDPSSLLWWMKRIIAMRKHYRSLGRGSIEFLHPANATIISYVRRLGDEIVLVAANLSGRTQYADLNLFPYAGYSLNDLLGGTLFPSITESSYRLTFGPYGYYVFSMTKNPSSPFKLVRSEIRQIKGQKSAASLFTGKSKLALESLILPEYLQASRWFEGKGRLLESVRIRSTIPLVSERERTQHFVIVVDVSYKEGLPEAYFLTVAYTPTDISLQLGENNRDSIIAMVDLGKEQKATLHEGVIDESFRAKLLSLVTKKRSFEGDNCEISGTLTTHHLGEKVLSNGIASRVLRVDQSNTSIVYGDKLFLKLIRRVEDGKSPEIEIGSVLAKHGFSSSPRLLGFAEYKTPESEPAAFMILQDYLQNEGDAWGLFSENFGRFAESALANNEFWNKSVATGPLVDRTPLPQSLLELLGTPFVEKVKLLAKRTGEFHLALIAETEDPDFAPEPFGYLYQVSIAQSMTNYATRVFSQIPSVAEVNEEVAKGISELLSMQSKLLEKFNALKSVTIDAVRARIHGDYHLGQVLHTGSDFVIIDYEGEPLRSIGERRTKRSPLRDVAAMLRSFQYVAYSYVLKSVVLQQVGEKDKLKKLVQVWSNAISRVYLSSYADTVKGSGIIPSKTESLSLMLDAYLFEKAIYEVGYELNNRPDWAIIPIRGIIDLINTSNATEQQPKPN